MALLWGCYDNDNPSASFISIYFTAYILQSTVLEIDEEDNSKSIEINLGIYGGCSADEEGAKESTKDLGNNGDRVVYKCPLRVVHWKIARPGDLAGLAMGSGNNPPEQWDHGNDQVCCLSIRLEK